MKKINKLILIGILLITATGCQRIREAKEMQESIKHYKEYYSKNWNNYPVSSVPTKKIIERYFKTAPYLVVWNWDIDGDGKKEYLALEEYPGVHRGFKRGILVREEGTILLYIDREKGLYAPDDDVFNYQKIGLQTNEVECLRLGFSENQENKKIRVFEIMQLDKDLNVITGGTRKSSKFSAQMFTRATTTNNKVVYVDFGMPLEGKDKIYEWDRQSIERYRVNKAKGIVFKYPEYEQDRKK